MATATPDRPPDRQGAGPPPALAARYYTDPAVFAREKERLFHATWQLACHGAEIPEPGDYVTFRLLDEPILVLRDRGGRARAFYNVCQHRAHELLEGNGNTRRIVCPYHAWTYELDGRLVGAPNGENVPGFDPAAICLPEIRIEPFLGFLFVNLDDAAPAMTEVFPGVEDQIRSFLPGAEAMAPVTGFAQDEPCNWKIAVENYNECYHCKNVHPTFVRGVVDGESFDVRPEGRVLRHRAEMAPAEHMSYASDQGPQAYSAWFLWPATSFQVYPGGMLNSFHWRPLGVAQTRICRGWYGGPDSDRATILKLAEQDRETTFAEDLGLIRSVQRGLKSRGYRPGPLMVDPRGGVASERSVQAIKAWLLEALG